MKRVLALLLALVMVFALCACSSTNEPKETQSGNEATSWDEIKPIKIVYAHANALSETNNKMVDNWMAAVEKASEGKISFDYHPGGSLGTYVEISYGGRSVIAVVNDRGPYVHGRVIDMQPAVARALGFLSVGVGTVQYRFL